MLTKNNKVINVKELTLEETINKLMPVNPILATIMSKLKANKTADIFYLASYKFGSKIINNQKAYLPLESGDSIAFDDPQLPDNLRDNLSYNSKTEDPLGVVLTKNSEFYLLGENHIQPSSIISPGQIFGIPRAIDDSPNTSSILALNLNAGCRSVFMLPKISDQINHSKLQEKYGVESSAPLSPQEHWNIFVELSRHAQSNWCSEVLYFSRNWISQIKTEERATLEVCLMQQHRKTYNIMHKVSHVWDKAFHEIEQKRSLNKSYPMQSLLTSKQLFKIAADVIPGFRPATTDDSAPISLIKEIYSLTYNKLAKHKYSPTIMEPSKFKSDNSVYYSLNYETYTENHLVSSKKKSQIALLEEIRIITEMYIKGILEDGVDIPSLSDIAKNIEFTYYHSNPESYYNIKNIALLLEDDHRFLSKKEEEFPNNAPFFKGCIKINKQH